jgi:carbon-monoxide dehydrogenase medium subunit
LTEIRFPLLGPGTGWSFKEVARRRGDFAMAGVVATMTKDEGGRISEPRVVLFGVGATPLRARQAEAVIEGERPGEPLFAEAATKAADSIEDPTADVHAPAQYRLDLARVLVARALEEACLRAAA